MRKTRRIQYLKANDWYNKHLRFLDRIGAYCSEDYLEHIALLKLRAIDKCVGYEIEVKQ